MHHDAISAEYEATEISKREGKPVAVVFHTQVYRHVLMSPKAARVCVDAGTALESQSVVCEGDYVFQLSDFTR